MHLTVIAKQPRAGHVKTRLCPPCTPDEAACIAEVALFETMRAVDAVHAELGAADDVRRVLLLEGDAPAATPPHFDVVEQSAGGLGDRLAAAFGELGPGLIVGMDTPHALGHLVDGVHALRRGDDVIGLTVDGGYWVVGLAGAGGAVFDGIVMSESHTGVAQLRRLHALGRSVRVLPMARDVDDFADLAALADGGVGGAFGETARRVVAAVRGRGADRLR